MKYTNKLWRKLYRQRIYGFDLILNNEDEKIKVIRYIKGHIISEYKDDNGNTKTIPDKLTNISIQVNTLLSSYSGFNAFLKCRDICRKDNRFKMKYMFIIKALR